MSSKKKKDAKFYAEVVLTTVLSLTVASLLIDLIKRMLVHHFDNSWEVCLMIAVVVGTIAIFLLKYIFSDE